MSMKYDLSAIRYNSKAKALIRKFSWVDTPQGYDFWYAQAFTGMTDEGRSALAEMKTQYMQEKKSHDAR